MNKDIRNRVREIMLELHGVHEAVKSFSEKISIETVDFLIKNHEKINDGNSWSLSSQVRSSEKEKKVTLIDIVTVEIEFTNASEKYIQGSFRSNKTILLDDGSYSINIKIQIKTDNVSEDLLRVKAVMAHELNHALVHLKDLKGKRKAFTLNQANSFAKSSLFELLKKHAALKEFATMVYLANPYEVQARVQEAGKELESISEKTPEDSLGALMQFNPLIDARKMNKYDLGEIKDVPKEDLKKFVETFNVGIKIFSKESNPKIIVDVDAFFSYWLDVINSSGRKLARKIYKLVADKYNIHEAFLFENSKFLYEHIFGEKYGF